MRPSGARSEGSRVTIADIARRSGVSKGAVSYVLNGRPGVSEATRARVLQVAADLHWVPNRAARSLSASRADAVGLAVARSPRTLRTEPFWMDLLAGLESVLAPRSRALLLQVVPDLDAEVAAHRRWWAERRVDAVLVVDARPDDPRVAALEELGLPAVVVGDPSLAGSLPSVWTDDAAAVHAAVRHLADLGHTRLARVAGLAGLGHVRLRDAAFAEACAEAGLRARTVRTDFSGEAGAARTRELLVGPDAPTALVYDNDLMAVAGLSAVAELGLRVPDDVTLVAWDDSALCRVTHPPLTAVGHDVSAFGALVAEHLLAHSAEDRSDHPAGAVPRSRQAATRTLRVRGSSGPPPAARGHRIQR